MVGFASTTNSTHVVPCARFAAPERGGAATPRVPEPRHLPEAANRRNRQRSILPISANVRI